MEPITDIGLERFLKIVYKVFLKWLSTISMHVQDKLKVGEDLSIATP